MNVIKGTLTEELIFQAIEQWIDLLAAEDYESAVDFLKISPNNQWSANLIRDTIRSHRVHSGQNGPSRVTRVSESSGGLTPRHDVNWEPQEASILAEVWYDMPLLGEWSDLTATFSLVPTETGISLMLEQLHMM